MGNKTDYTIPTLKNTIRQLFLYFFTLLFTLIYLPTYAQTTPDLTKPTKNPYEWEVGVFLGAGTVFGDIAENNTEAIGAMQPAFGLSINRNLTETLALRGGITYAKLKGSRTFQNTSENSKVRSISKLSDFSAALYFEPLGEKRRPQIGHFEKIISPYLLVGIGASFGKAETFYENIPTNPEIAADDLDKTAYRAHLLLGAGVKYDLSRKLVIGLEVGLRPTFDDFLDGISQAGNPDKNDWFGFGGVTLHYRIGEPDTDLDGIADVDDKCPDAPGDKKFSGCPDSDGDGIQDSKDDCPDIFGSSVLHGCPDSDKDGIADHLDKCPDEKGMMRMNGCPDKDWDLVIDSEDDCPEVAGKVELNGCPEVIKEILAEAATSPEITEEESQIETPASAQSVIIPNEKEEAMEVIEEKVTQTIEGVPTFESIQFAEDSNSFDAETYRILTEIAEILPQYPDMMLHISSYAEIGQNGVVNQGIAGKRVYSCFKYLLQKGIPRTQLVYYNYKKLPEDEEENGKVFFELKE